MSDFNDEAMQRYPFAQIIPPLNWSLVVLEDISVDVSPGFASGKHNSDGTGIPHLRPMNVDRDGQIDLNVVKSVAESNGIELQPGDVLFNNTNSAELVGKTAVVSTRETGFAFSNHMTRIRPEFGVNPTFAARQLHFLWMAGYMKHRCTNHVNQASISSKTLAKTIPFLLPPADEQTRIVAKLEELLFDLDAGVAELTAAQKKLGQYRQSLLKAAVEGALTAKWRAQNTPSETGAQLLERILTERRARWEAKQLAKFTEQGKNPPKDWQKKYPEPAQPDTTDLPKLQEGWVWASVEQLGDVQLGRQRSPDKLKGISPTRYIRAANITEAGVDFSDVLEMDFSEQERRTFELQAGDILLTEASGSAEHVGRPAIWPIVDGLYCFQNTVLRFQAEGVSSEFAFYAFLAMQKLGVFRKLSGGVGINHLSAGKFSKLSMALPSSDEQVEIVRELVEQLAAIDEQGRAIDLSLKQSSAQRQNILRAAFAGELVPQDPNDEPASVLLERIRAERAERAKQPKTRKTKQQKEIATVVNQLIDVLRDAGDWVPAQEVFRRCGVADGALTERIEKLYAELRKLDKAGQLAVEAVTDAQGRKLYDKLKLLAG